MPTSKRSASLRIKTAISFRSATRKTEQQQPDESYRCMEDGAAQAEDAQIGGKIRFWLPLIPHHLWHELPEQRR